MQFGEKNLSRRLLNRLLLLISVTVLAAATLLIRHNWQVEHEALHKQANDWARELRHDLEDSLTHDAQGLQQTLQVISVQPAMKQALARGDVARLEADWKGVFEQLRSEHHITHFYFVSHDRICQLRMHLPDQRGDRIDRHTLLEAERTGKVAWGVEMGKTGVLTLRVVQPIFEQGRLLGYVELGEELTHLLTGVRPPDEHAYRYAILLDKRRIDRTSWENGMRMLGRQADWADFPRHVVEFMDPKLTAQGMRTILARPNVDSAPVHEELDGRRWHVQFTPFRDVAGAEVGTLLVLHDITALEATIEHRATMLLVVTLAVAGFVLISFFWVAKRFSRQLSGQEMLLRESESRFRTLFNASPDPVWIMADHRVLECNRAAVELMGYSDQAAFKGVHPASFSPEFQPDGESSFSKAERMMNLVQKQGINRFEWKQRRMDGTDFDAEVTLSAMTLQGREVIHAIVRDITDAHSTAKTLQRFRDTLNQIHDCVFMFEKDSLRFTYVNQGAMQQVGHDEQTLLEMHPYDIMPDYPEPAFRAMIAPFINGEIAYTSFETRHRHRDGQDIPVDIFLQLVSSEDGPPLFVAIVRDIAERKKAEQALRSSEERFDLALRAASDGLWDWNLQTQEVYFSPRWKTMLGYADDELANSFAIWEQLVDDEGRARTMALINQCIAGQAEGFSTDFRMRHKDGHWVEVLSRAILVRDEHGAAKRMVGTHVDITERKAAEEALRQSEERYRALFDNSADAILLHPLTCKTGGIGRFIEANAAAIARYGYSRDEFLAMTPLDLDEEHTFSSPEQLATFQAQMIQAGHVMFERVHVSKGGQRIPVEVSAHVFELKGEVLTLSVVRDITERKRSEASLRKSENDLKEAQRLAKVGSWDLDIPGNRLTWSDEIFRIFEIDPARFAASYEAFLDAIHPEDREAVNNAYADSLQTRQPYSIRHRLLMPDGRVKHVHEQCRTDFDEEGQPLRSVGTVQDVTEQVQAEGALNDARNLLRVVIDNVPMRVFWKDRALNYLGCNPGFAQDAGLSHPRELIGKSDFQMGWAHEAELYRADDQKIIDSGVPRINYEEPQTAPEGQTIWLRTSKVPLRNDNGETIGVLGMYQDITAEKNKDEELARHREHLEELVADRSARLAEANFKYQQLLDDMGDEFLAFSYTPENIVTYVSNGFDAIFGQPKETVLGQTWEGSVQWLPEDLEATRRAVQELFAGKVDVIQMEIRFVHPDGQVRTVYQVSHVVKNASGDIVSVDGVLTDITVRKLTEAELWEAKRLAEAASQAKSAFLANMSHEIRTPMNGVLGMLEILSRSTLAVEERKMVETIRRSARSLLNLLDDILDLSKIEAGKLSLVEEEISLESELDVMIGLMDRIALDKQVDFCTFFEPTLPQLVIGDGLRVRQILTNLTGNAVKFSAGMERIGRVRLRAELDRCEDGLAWVVFTIVDNGIGMDAETVAHLFRPFEQADASTTRKYGGTGLGLSISQNLTAMMGGEISVQSAPGQGTTFTVRLPFKLASACPAPTSPYDLSGLECVIVANEPNYVDDYTRYLVHAGAHPHAVADLDSAWDFVAGLAPELPVCMIVMEDPAAQSAQEIVDHLLARQPHDNVHLVNVAYMSVERGKRRRVRRLADKVVQIDREALTRRRFLEATAVATRRAAIPQETDRHERLDAPASARLSILVAEDNEVNQDVIQRQLEMLGHRADLAGDGQKAFRKWETGIYDLLLTDLHMPNKDGYELTTMIREAERQAKLRPIPIIALTANAMKGEEERCLALGMDGYLSKPIELDRLKAELDQWMTRHAPPVAQAAVRDLASDRFEQSGLPVFDLKALNKIVGTNPAIHRRLLTKFLESAQDRMHDLLKACEARDAEAVGQLAHPLKSAARSVGAMRLGELSERVEHAGKAGDREACLALSQSLNEALADTVQAIATRLESL